VTTVSDEPEMNEIEAAAHEAKRVREAAAATEAERSDKAKGNWPLLSIGIGMGSAALAAALLYARRGKE
jgi:hypothetical protein